MQRQRHDTRQRLLGGPHRLLSSDALCQRVTGTNLHRTWHKNAKQMVVQPVHRLQSRAGGSARAVPSRPARHTPITLLPRRPHDPRVHGSGLRRSCSTKWLKRRKGLRICGRGVARYKSTLTGYCIPRQSSLVSGRDSPAALSAPAGHARETGTADGTTHDITDTIRSRWQAPDSGLMTDAPPRTARRYLAACSFGVGGLAPERTRAVTRDAGYVYTEHTRALSWPVSGLGLSLSLCSCAQPRGAPRRASRRYNSHSRRYNTVAP